MFHSPHHVAWWPRTWLCPPALVQTALAPWALASNLPSCVPAHCLLAHPVLRVACSPKLLPGSIYNPYRIGFCIHWVLVLKMCVLTKWISTRTSRTYLKDHPFSIALQWHLCCKSGNYTILSLFQ